MTRTTQIKNLSLRRPRHGTQDLWWLICIVNKIQNPIDNPKLGEVYKVIKADYVSLILTEIKKATNNTS